MIWSWSLDFLAKSDLGVDERLTKRPGVHHEFNQLPSHDTGTTLEVFHHLLDPHFVGISAVDSKLFMYPLVICYSSLLKLAHRNSWFTELKEGDFPVRYVSLPEGMSQPFLGPTTYRCWSFWCRLHPDKGGDKQQFQQLQAHQGRPLEVFMIRSRMTLPQGVVF
jgi:hypothetical protein